MMANFPALGSRIIHNNHVNRSVDNGGDGGYQKQADATKMSNSLNNWQNNR